MIIDDDNASDDETAGQQDVAGTAYRETITSVDGFTRGANGRVKFNKNTKKRRREDDELEDVEMADVEASANKSKKNKQKTDVKFGQEFKAKVPCPLLDVLYDY
jgi:ribosomal RNA-processing protein 12